MMSGLVKYLVGIRFRLIRRHDWTDFFAWNMGWNFCLRVKVHRSVIYQQTNWLRELRWLFDDFLLSSFVVEDVSGFSPEMEAETFSSDEEVEVEIVSKLTPPAVVVGECVLTGILSLWPSQTLSLVQRELARRMSSMEMSYLSAMPANVSLLLTVCVKHSRETRPNGEDLERIESIK